MNSDRDYVSARQAEDREERFPILQAGILIAFAIACAIYGTVIMSMRSGTHFHLAWYGLAAFLLLAGLVRVTGVWQGLPQALRVSLNVVFLAVAVLLIAISVRAMVAAQAGKKLVAAADADPASDPLSWLIILGAQVRPDQRPSRVLAFRIDAAARCLETHPDCHVIVSGGKGPNEPISEAACMARELQARGISASRILLEDRSTTTIENLRFCGVLLSQRGIVPAAERVGIVTNDFHLYRSLKIARREGFTHAVGISAYSIPAYMPNNLLRESLCIIKDWLSGAR